MGLDEHFERIQSHNHRYIQDLVRVEVLGLRAWLNRLEHVERGEFHARKGEREDEEGQDAEAESGTDWRREGNWPVKKDDNEDERGESKGQKTGASICQVEPNDLEDV